MQHNITFTTRLPRERTNRKLEARIRRLEKMIKLLDDAVWRRQEETEDLDIRLVSVERADRDIELLEDRISNIEDALRSAANSFDI